MVSAPAHGNWYDFITNKFLPQLEALPIVKKVVMSRVLGEQVQTHFTYSIQMHIEEIYLYAHLKKDILNDMQNFSAELFDTEVTHFITVMKVIVSSKD